MGRIFEVRKHTMFARWDRMAKAFSRISKEITIAVKAGGTDPHSNPALRRVIQNARAVNMPKDKVEAAIKRASGKDAASYEQIIYEGYAPHGVAGDRRDAPPTTRRARSRTVRAHLHEARRQPRRDRQRRVQVQQMGVFRLKPDGHRLRTTSSSS